MNLMVFSVVEGSKLQLEVETVVNQLKAISEATIEATEMRQ